jgi:hypothetical protein
MKNPNTNTSLFRDLNQAPNFTPKGLGQINTPKTTHQAPLNAWMLKENWSTSLSGKGAENEDYDPEED